MSTSREVNNETMACVNSRFAEVTEEGILRMQDNGNAIPNNTNKATKLRMKVFRGKQCFLKHTICSHVQSSAITVLSKG